MDKHLESRPLAVVAEQAPPRTKPSNYPEPFASASGSMKLTNRSF